MFISKEYYIFNDVKLTEDRLKNIPNKCSMIVKISCLD